MNLLGKIFVVLIVVMSLVFMSFSLAVYSTHQNWKKVATETKGRLTEAQGRLEEKTKEKEDLEKEVEREMTARKQALAKLETERDELQKQFDLMSKEREELRQKDQAAVAALDVAQKNLAKLTTEVDGLREEIREAQGDRDKSFEQVVKLTDETHQAQGELRRLGERNVQLAAQIGALRAPAAGPPPQARGKILAINQDNMLEASLGKDDGLREGHTLEIFRGSKYLGRAEVLYTQPDRSVAKILPAYRKGPIQKGDDIATQLKSD